MLAVKSGLENNMARQQAIAYQPARKVELKPRSVEIAQHHSAHVPCLDSECCRQMRYPEEFRSVRHHPASAGSFKLSGSERVRYLDFLGQMQLVGA